MFAHTRKKFLRFCLLFGACTLLLCVADGYHASSLAQDGSYTVSIPIYGQVEQRSLISEAESLASQLINEQFRQNSSLETLEVTVLGERNGEVIPILSVRVARNQWQETPMVSAWAEYNSASYALLRRHEEVVAVARDSSGNNATAPIDRVRSYSTEGGVQRAYEEGLLSGAEAQIHLDALD